MKSVELTAYTVREYDVKYTVVLDENDPLIQEMLINNNMSFDDFLTLDYSDYRGLWDTLMSITTQEIDIQEDFGQGDERFVDFEAFVTETM